MKVNDQKNFSENGETHIPVTAQSPKLSSLTSNLCSFQPSIPSFQVLFSPAMHLPITKEARGPRYPLSNFLSPGFTVYPFNAPVTFDAPQQPAPLRKPFKHEIVRLSRFSRYEDPSRSLLLLSILAARGGICRSETNQRIFCSECKKELTQARGFVSQCDTNVTISDCPNPLVMTSPTQTFAFFTFARSHHVDSCSMNSALDWAIQSSFQGDYFGLFYICSPFLFSLFDFKLISNYRN